MWLVANGRIEEAEKVLQDMARYNGVKAPARLLSTSAEKEHLMSKSEEKPVKTWKEVEGRANGTQNMSVQNVVVNPPLYSWTQLFTDPTMRLQTIVSSLLWYVNLVSLVIKIKEYYFADRLTLLAQSLCHIGA